MLRYSPNPNQARLIRWFEWEGDAFRKARGEDKPVMLFLSAFWCRYCQRMDEEAFSDRENMALLNAYFVALRAEDAMRPDIDARYNLNGWPTIAFLSPAGELLAAANFLGIEDFKNLLLNVYLAYQNKDKRRQPSEPASTSENPRGGSAGKSAEAILAEISDSIMSAADHTNGGYGQGQKFIHPWVNDFLLRRYETTRNAACLDHVRLTLDRMRQGQIHDVEEGGYFRTTTGADWSQPHREKLLVEQAGLLSNCLNVFRLTECEDYARMAEGIIAYVESKLWDAQTGAFFGCEDFIRRETAADSPGGEMFSIIDECIYSDANAVAAAAYLQAGALLGRTDCTEKALSVLDFLWSRCRSADEGVCHYHDGEPRLAGLLGDQALVGTALLEAHAATGAAKYLQGAREIAKFITARLRNPAGGFHDRAGCDAELLKSPLIDLEQSGAAASFFTALARVSGDTDYTAAARWALAAAQEHDGAYDMHAARFGRALSEFLNSG